MQQVLFDASLIPALAVALIGGLISFLSPCVLPIVPAYLGYMAGVSPRDMEAGGGRSQVLKASFWFVIGLSTVFIFLGFAASWIGRLYLPWRDALSVAAGVVIMIFGAHFIGVFRLRFLDREYRLQAGSGGSAAGAYVLGLAFAFGWTPCIGPILGAIISIAMTQDSVARGTLMLATYALGLGLPFLLVGVFFQRLQPLVRFLTRHLDRIEKISGLLLWTVGLMLVTGQFSDLSYWLIEMFPALAAIG